MEVRAATRRSDSHLPIAREFITISAEDKPRRCISRDQSACQLVEGPGILSGARAAKQVPPRKQKLPLGRARRQRRRDG